MLYYLFTHNDLFTCAVLRHQPFILGRGGAGMYISKWPHKRFSLWKKDTI